MQPSDNKTTKRTQIKVNRCLDSILWYSKHVGKTFELERESERYYWVREPDSWRCLNFVLKSDAEIVLSS